MRRIAAINILFVFVLSYTASAGILVEKLDKGELNWQKQTVRATGTGIVDKKLVGTPQGNIFAKRAAQLDAYRNLLEIVKGVTIDAKSTVNSLVLTSDEITSRVNGIVKGAKEVAFRVAQDGSTVEVEYELTLNSNGDLGKVIYGQINKKEEFGSKTDKATKPEPVKPVDKSDTRDVYTGLIIDARGVEMKPALLTRLLDESGKEIYGPAFFDIDYAIKWGIAGYSKDLDKAKTDERVANKPLVIRPLRAEGDKKTDLVIHNIDAKILTEVKESQNFMRQCRVIIIVE